MAILQKLQQLTFGYQTENINVPISTLEVMLNLPPYTINMCVIEKKKLLYKKVDMFIYFLKHSINILGMNMIQIIETIKHLIKLMYLIAKVKEIVSLNFSQI